MWIVGRSVVIHKAAAPYDRWACANIGSAGVGATVNFPQTTGKRSPSPSPSPSHRHLRPNDRCATASCIPTTPHAYTPCLHPTPCLLNRAHYSLQPTAYISAYP